MMILWFLLSALATVFADGEDWNHLSAKYGLLGWIDYKLNNGFWDLPTNAAAAAKLGWQLIDNPNQFGLNSYARDTDYRVVVLHHNDGLAAIQISVNKADMERTKPPAYDFSIFGVMETKIVAGVTVYSSTAYFVDPAVLRQNGNRLNVNTIGDGLWFQNGTSFTKVPYTLDQLTAEGVYTEQTCIPSMGTHYYYKMDKNTDCANFSPYFLLYQNGKVVGLGWQVFGSTSSGKYNYWDSINGLKAKLTVPHSPQCLVDWVNQYQSTSIHIYFVDQPWNIGC